MKRILSLGLIVLLAGCAQQAPSLQEGPDAEVTFDGLVRIDNARFSHAWVDPEIDMSRYSKIIPMRADFEFRAVRETTTSMARSNESEFWISDRNRERLVEIVTEAFTDELGRSEHFTITDTPASDTLIIIGTLHDIVSRVPPEHVGRSDIWLSSVGEATLVLVAKDSLSGETVYRAVDRRAAERVGSMTRSNTVSNTAEVRRLARRWASRLREGLDSIHE